MKKPPLSAVVALSLSLIASGSRAETPLPEGPIADSAGATVEGKYAGPDGKEVEISGEFGEATWGQVFEKLAEGSEITWTKTEPNDASVTGVQATFTPKGAPDEISVTFYLLKGPDGVRFDRLKLTEGEESREKSGLEAIEMILGGYKGGGKKAAVSALNLNQAKQLILGCLLYSADNDGAFPPDIDALVKGDLIPEKLQWRHPETGELSDFLYHGAGESNRSPATVVIIAAPHAFEGKRTVAFADGSAQNFPEAEYQKAIK